MANLDEGTVLGGRYQITGRVMASSQQDQVLTGIDQVLNREVLILVASPENASQAAQSARQLATGERASSIQILDLGLSGDQTYLVAPGNSDVESLLALLTNQEVYVEPFFTEALGTELFGETRSHTPQTFDDDAEYYAELQDELKDEQDDTTNRPEFLNKLSDRIDNWLEEEDEAPLVSGRDDEEDVSTQQTEQQAPPPATRSRLPILDDDQDSVEDRDQYRDRDQQRDWDPDRTQVVPPITDDQPEAAAAARQHSSPDQPAEERSSQRPSPIIPPALPDHEPTANEGYAIQYTDEPQRSTMGRWLAGLLLVGILVGAVVIGFQFLGGTEDEEPPVADEQTEQPPAEDDEEETDDEATEEEEETPDAPDPQPASVQRVVPDSPELSNEYEADLPAIVDGNQATAWHTLTFTTPQFGGFASNLALIVELEEQAPISEVTIHQNQGTGGAFTVAVSNEPDPNGGVMVSEGSFTGPEYTVDTLDDDGEPIEANYVIVNFTELPTLSNTNSPDRPYGLRIAEIEVD